MIKGFVHVTLPQFLQGGSAIGLSVAGALGSSRPAMVIVCARPGAASIRKGHRLLIHRRSGVRNRSETKTMDQTAELELFLAGRAKDATESCMRALLFLIIVLSGNAAAAQQCSQCIAADDCIKEYTRAVTKIKTDYRKGLADQRKGREQSLRDRFSSRSAVTDQDGLDQTIRSEIEKLRDCLARAR